MKLIDKDAVVAEIERLAEVKPIDEFQPQVQNKIDWLSGKLFAINSLRVFLDTLEVKEVDLEKEYKEYVEEDPVYNKLVNGIVGKAIAKHFFELGLRTKEDI